MASIRDIVAEHISSGRKLVLENINIHDEAIRLITRVWVGEAIAPIIPTVVNICEARGNGRNALEHFRRPDLASTAGYDLISRCAVACRRV